MSRYRLLVLNMLADGRIGVDDAELLLYSGNSADAAYPRRTVRMKHGIPTPAFMPPTLPTEFSGTTSGRLI